MNIVIIIFESYYVLGEKINTQHALPKGYRPLSGDEYGESVI